MSAATFKVFEVYLVVALYYLALTTVWTVIQTWIENVLNARAGLPPAESIWKRLFGLRTRRQSVTRPPVLQPQPVEAA